MAEYYDKSVPNAQTSDQQDLDTQPTPGPSVQEWLSLIDTAQRDLEEYTRRCDKIRDRYLNEASKKSQRRRYQMLWSNQEILRPSVYAKRPNPSVESRFKDGNPVSRIASELLERTLDFQFDLGDYDTEFKAIRDDYLLYARGVGRVRYEPVYNEDEVYEGGDGEDATGPKGAAADASGEQGAVLNFENVRLDFIDRKDFIHPFCRRWKELPWLCYRAFMDRQELIERWPKIGHLIPLDSKEKSSDRDMTDSATDKATIYEVWDKRRWRVMFFAKAYPDILEDIEPYLKLEGFYPSPKPAYGTMSTESLVPVPDFVFYQDQAEEIDDLTARIGSLTDSLKVVGFYPAGPEGEGSPEIERAAKPGFENKMVAVKAWAMFTQGGGKDGVPIVFYPVQIVADVIKQCVELRKQLIDDIYQITGIADIMRGDTDANETKGAQAIKAQWGNIRLRERQKEIARFARDVTRMAAQVIANHFQIKTLLDTASMSLPTDAEVQAKQAQFKMQQAQYAMLQQRAQAIQAQQHAAVPGGLPGAPQAPGAPPQSSLGGAPGPGGPPPQMPQLPPPPQWQDPGPTQEQVMALLRDNVVRHYMIDIESDSTIAADEQAEQQQRTQFIAETGKFLVSFMPIVKEEPALAQLAGELLKFGTRAFPIARELESVIEQTMDKIVAQSGQPAPPSPEQLKAQLMQVKGQAEMQRTQMDMRATQMRTQAEMQKAELDAQSDAAAHQMDLQRTQMEGQQAAMEHGHAMQQAAAKQRTLEQTMQIAEQRAVAKNALSAVGYGPRTPGRN